MRQDQPAASVKCLRVRIEGRVQGVGFRAWVELNAKALGVDGWVRNRRDGGVEAVFSGDPHRLDDLLARCRSGPRSARVDMFRSFPEEPLTDKGFRVLATA